MNFCQQKNVFDKINLQEIVDVNNLISQLINAIFKNRYDFIFVFYFILINRQRKTCASGIYFLICFFALNFSNNLKSFYRM